MNATDHLHSVLTLGAGDAVEVTLDHPANVQLMDSDNYEKYRNGQTFRYHGGYVKRSPYVLQGPGPGIWHLVIDLGGAPGRVLASVRVLSRQAS